MWIKEDREEEYRDFLRKEYAEEFQEEQIRIRNAWKSENKEAEEERRLMMDSLYW